MHSFDWRFQQHWSGDEDHHDWLYLPDSNELQVGLCESSHCQCLFLGDCSSLWWGGQFFESLWKPVHGSVVIQLNFPNSQRHCRYKHLHCQLLPLSFSVALEKHYHCVCLFEKPKHRQRPIVDSRSQDIRFKFQHD